MAEPIRRSGDRLHGFPSDYPHIAGNRARLFAA
jgi:hypothetical protein